MLAQDGGAFAMVENETGQQMGLSPCDRAAEPLQAIFLPLGLTSY